MPTVTDLPHVRVQCQSRPFSSRIISFQELQHKNPYSHQPATPSHSSRTSNLLYRLPFSSSPAIPHLSMDGVWRYQVLCGVRNWKTRHEQGFIATHGDNKIWRKSVPSLKTQVQTQLTHTNPSTRRSAYRFVRTPPPFRRHIHRTRRYTASSNPAHIHIRLDNILPHIPPRIIIPIRSKVVQCGRPTLPMKIWHLCFEDAAVIRIMMRRYVIPLKGGQRRYCFEKPAWRDSMVRLP